MFKGVVAAPQSPSGPVADDPFASIDGEDQGLGGGSYWSWVD